MNYYVYLPEYLTPHKSSRDVQEQKKIISLFPNLKWFLMPTRHLPLLGIPGPPEGKCNHPCSSAPYTTPASPRSASARMTQFLHLSVLASPSTTDLNPVILHLGKYLGNDL